MHRRWLLAITTVVAALSLVGVDTAAAFVVAADSYVYDAPLRSRVELDVAATTGSALSQVSDRSAGPSPRSSSLVGASTKFNWARNATNNVGDEHRYTERELKEAEQALRRNQDFRRWFHREYKADVGSGVGGRDNPDLDRELVRDAYEEWLNCGRPGG